MGCTGMSQRMSTPSCLSLGRCVCSAASVPSGVYCMTLTSYMTEFFDRSGWSAGSVLGFAAMEVAGDADAAVAESEPASGLLEQAAVVRSAVTAKNLCLIVISIQCFHA